MKDRVEKININITGDKTNVINKYEDWDDELGKVVAKSEPAEHLNARHLNIALHELDDAHNLDDIINGDNIQSITLTIDRKNRGLWISILKYDMDKNGHYILDSNDKARKTNTIYSINKIDMNLEVESYN